MHLQINSNSQHSGSQYGITIHTPQQGLAWNSAQYITNAVNVSLLR